MLIAVRNIKLTCEWYKAIKLNYKNTRTRVIAVLRFPSILRRPRLLWRQSYRALTAVYKRTTQAHWTSITSQTAYSTWTPRKPTHFDGHYLRNRSTLDIGVLGYIGIVWPKEYSPEVWHIPPVTPCIYIYILYVVLFTFCLYLFGYPDTLHQSRRTCHVKSRRLLFYAPSPSCQLLVALRRQVR